MKLGPREDAPYAKVLDFDEEIVRMECPRGCLIHQLTEVVEDYADHHVRCSSCKMPYTMPLLPVRATE